MDAPPDYRFGDTEVRVEGNLLRIRAHGHLALEVAQQVMQLLKQQHQQHGRYYVLLDLSQAGSVPPKLRRLMAEEIRAFAPAAAAFYGGNMVVRAMAALVIGAVTLINGQRKSIASFATEAQALAWMRAVEGSNFPY